MIASHRLLSSLRSLRPLSTLALSLLSLHCSRPSRWSLSASPAPSSTNAQIVVLEASQEPTVSRSFRGEQQLIDPISPTTWPGHAEFFLRPEAGLNTIRLDGSCPSGSKTRWKGGLCGTAHCDPPAASFLRIHSTRSVQHWSVNASSGPVEVQLDSAGHYRRSLFVEASRRPDVWLATTVPGTTPSILVLKRSAEWKIDIALWRDRHSVAPGHEVTIEVVASIAGPCASTTPCGAAPSEFVRFTAR